MGLVMLVRCWIDTVSFGEGRAEGMELGLLDESSCQNDRRRVLRLSLGEMSEIV